MDIDQKKQNYQVHTALKWIIYIMTVCSFLTEKAPLRFI